MSGHVSSPRSSSTGTKRGDAALLTRCLQCASVVYGTPAAAANASLHAAFDGPTPDEMYFGTGAHVPAQPAAARAEARRRRLERNRAARCNVCSA
jgi:hypothetical protein